MQGSFNRMKSVPWKEVSACCPHLLDTVNWDGVKEGIVTTFAGDPNLEIVNYITFFQVSSLFRRYFGTVSHRENLQELLYILYPDSTTINTLSHLLFALDILRFLFEPFEENILPFYP